MENEKDVELKKDLELSQDDFNWYFKADKILEDKGVIGRKKYNSLFLTNFRDNDRKRISFDFCYKLITFCYESIKN